MPALGRMEMPGFVPYRRHDPDGEPMLTYVEEHNPAAFAHNLSGRLSRHEHPGPSDHPGARGHFDARKQLRGRTASEVVAQTRLVHRLATPEPGPSLVGWKISGSRTGIPVKALADGRTAAELLGYLRGPEEGALHRAARQLNSLRIRCLK